MTDYKIIDVKQAKQLLQGGIVQCIDIRDAQMYQEQHLPKAINVTQQQLKEFFLSADRTAPTLVYCYEGISSLKVAESLVDYGFSDVYSLEGGFAAWQQT